MSNVSLEGDGIRLSPRVNLIGNIGEPYVWCLTRDEYQNIYIGTGDPGTVYKLTPTGSLILLHRFSELYVQSLAVSPNGHIFVGTSPQGIIYKITPWREVIMLCDLPDAYVWKLLCDATGTLYAATGPEGKIYRISQDGDVDVLFDSAQTHILDMVTDRNGNIYACSEPDGLIYRITPSGEAFVVYDAEEGEIHSLTLDSLGNLYAGTASGARPQVPVTPPAPPTTPFPEPLPSVAGTPPVGTRASQLQQEVPPPPRLPRRPGIRPAVRPPLYGRTPQKPNFVYKITPDGTVTKALEVERGFIFALCTDEWDNIYAGTGNDARLYKIDKDGDVSALLEVKESQVLSLLFMEQRGLFFGTGNEGNLYELSKSYAQTGVFDSSVFDAEIISSWGNIYWEADVPKGTNITIATRTGNSKKPDNTWSKWSAVYTPGAKVESPPSRFIQYRATLSTAVSGITPLLKSLSIAYLPKNQPPEIVSLTVNEEPVQGQPGRGRRYGPPHRTPKPPIRRLNNARPPALKKPTEVKRLPRPGTKVIEWQTTDPNNDSLNFALYYKGVEEKDWKFLRKETEKSSYTWQTTRVPDGKYQIKLVASDEPDNPPEIALNTKKISPPFIIDNTRPRLINLSTKTDNTEVLVEGTAVDELSNISRLQYSIDAAEWVSIFPRDMIFDSKEESFHFTIHALKPGEHTVVINATDRAGNIGSGKVLVEISE